MAILLAAFIMQGIVPGPDNDVIVTRPRGFDPSRGRTVPVEVIRAQDEPRRWRYFMRPGVPQRRLGLSAGHGPLIGFGFRSTEIFCGNANSIEGYWSERW